MRRVTRYVLTGVLAAGLAAPALPAIAQTSSPSSSPSMTSPAPSQPQPNDRAMEESGFVAHVSGRVTSVDHQSGKMTLDTLDGPMTVRLPPNAVASVQQGDQVTVGVGLMENGPAASPSTAPGSSSSGGSSSYGSSSTGGSMHR